MTIRVITPPGRAKQGMFALDVGVRALDFFDDFFALPYPLPKLDMLCVTEFAMGGESSTFLYPIPSMCYVLACLFVCSHGELGPGHVSRERVDDRRCTCFFSS